MTLFHFGNCLALSCGPHFILYKSSGLAEYQSSWKLAKVAICYFLTQLGKMLVLASFFPLPEGEENAKMDIISEFMKSTMDLSDLLAIHLLMSQTPGKGALKILIAGLGWSSAEFVTTKLIPLWVGFRAIEFDWKYTMLSFDNNINLVLYLTIATLIWLWSRTDLQKVYVPVVIMLLILASYQPVVMGIASHTFKIAAWNLLILKAVYTSAIGGLSLQMYLGLTKTLKTY